MRPFGGLPSGSRRCPVMALVWTCRGLVRVPNRLELIFQRVRFLTLLYAIGSERGNAPQ